MTRPQHTAKKPLQLIAVVLTAFVIGGVIAACGGSQDGAQVNNSEPHSQSEDRQAGGVNSQSPNTRQSLMEEKAQALRELDDVQRKITLTAQEMRSYGSDGPDENLTEEQKREQADRAQRWIEELQKLKGDKSDLTKEINILNSKLRKQLIREH